MMISNGVASEYEMRPATPEERKAVQDYIDSISVETGFNIYDLQEQVKIYDAYYNRGFSDGKKAAFEKISNTIEAMIYHKTDEYGADIVEMYKEIVDDLQDFIVKGIENNE